MLEHKIFNLVPVLNLVLNRLHRMHPIQAIDWHPQALTKWDISTRSIPLAIHWSVDWDHSHALPTAAARDLYRTAITGTMMQITA